LIILFKIHYSKLQENLANKEIIINDLKLLIELTRDELSLLDNTNKKLQKDKEALLSNINDINNEIKQYGCDSKSKNIENSINDKNKNNVENEIRQKLEENFKQLLMKKEDELADKFKEKEFILREECSKGINELNKNLQEKILQNEKLIFEMEIMKSKLNTKEIDDKDIFDELKAKILLLETDNQKLVLTNKMNNEFIEQIEAKNLNAEKEKINNNENLFKQSETSLNPKTYNNNSNKQNSFYKNEILIIELKSQISKLENSIEAKEKIIENLKEKIKEFTQENLRKDFELKNNLYGVKNKELNELLIKIQKKQKKKKKKKILENEELKKNLDKSLQTVNELEDIIKNKYTSIELNLENEKNEKEILDNQLKELTKIYKENHENFLEENFNLKDLLIKKEEELEKMKCIYEKRIQQVIFFNLFIVK